MNYDHTTVASALVVALIIGAAVGAYAYDPDPDGWTDAETVEKNINTAFVGLADDISNRTGTNVSKQANWNVTDVTRNDARDRWEAEVDITVDPEYGPSQTVSVILHVTPDGEEAYVAAFKGPDQNEFKHIQPVPLNNVEGFIEDLVPQDTAKGISA